MDHFGLKIQRFYESMALAVAHHVASVPSIPPRGQLQPSSCGLFGPIPKVIPSVLSTLL